MFEELVVVGKGLEEENEKYKMALNDHFTPYNAHKEKEIKTLRVQFEESVLREEHLKKMLKEKDGEVVFLTKKVNRSYYLTWSFGRERISTATKGWPDEQRKR